MTISLTPISKNQWIKVAKVFFWLAVSFGLATGVALITKDAKWLAAAPGFNFAVFTLTQVFQNEEDTAQSAIPASEQPVVNEAVDAVKAALPPANQLQ